MECHEDFEGSSSEQLLLSAFVILLIRQQAQIYGLGLRRTWCSTWRHVVTRVFVEAAGFFNGGNKISNIP